MRAKKNVAPVKTQGQELVEAISALCAEKGISEEMMFQTVETALKKA